MAIFRALGALMLVACGADRSASTSECLCAADSSAEDAGCGDASVWIYPKAGCDVAPVCVPPADTGCVTIVCGCDGIVHADGCEGARRPWRYGQDLGPLEPGTSCGGSDGGGG